MKIKAIITDGGGVLIREVDKSARVPWQEKLGLTKRQLTHEVYRTGVAKLATIGQAKYETLWSDMGRKFALTANEVARLQADFHAGDKLNTPLYEFIKELHKKYKTAILSNAWSDSRGVYIKRYHLDKIVDIMILSAEEGLKKPNKGIFRVVLKHLEVSPEEVVYIDDRPDNIRTAKSLGMHAVLFKHTQEAIAEIKSLIKSS